VGERASFLTCLFPGATARVGKKLSPPSSSEGAWVQGCVAHEQMRAPTLSLRKPMKRCRQHGTGAKKKKKEREKGALTACPCQKDDPRHRRAVPARCCDSVHALRYQECTRLLFRRARARAYTRAHARTRARTLYQQRHSRRGCLDLAKIT